MHTAKKSSDKNQGAKKRKVVKGPVVKRFKIIDEDASDEPFENVDEKPPDVMNEDLEPIDEPLVVLVDNKVDELKLIGRFKVDNWQSVDSRQSSSKDDFDSRSHVKRSKGSRSPSPAAASDSDISIRGRSPRLEDDDDLDVDRNPKPTVKQEKVKVTLKKVPVLRAGEEIAVKRQDQYKKHKGRPKKELSEEEKQRIKAMQEKYALWNKGTKQAEERTQKLEQMTATLNEPFARYKDDANLDEDLKSQLHEDDPMFAYMKQKQQIKGKSSTKSSNVPNKYAGHAALNRYHIVPGIRWDGVDRSNGFEKRLLSRANDRKADEDEYYAWSSGRYE